MLLEIVAKPLIKMLVKALSNDVRVIGEDPCRNVSEGISMTPGGEAPCREVGKGVVK
jgi:hypothetical protein